MKTRALAVTAASTPFISYEFERRALRPNDIAIDITYAGICHSDIHQVREEWGPAIFPMVPGHEIVGRVSALGSAVTSFTVGESVGVGVFVDSCRTCDACKKGLGNY